MLFINSPSPLAPVDVWEKYIEQLNNMNPNEKTVIQEKLRAKNIIQTIKEEDLKD